jgi:hypothetical protein
MRSSSSPFMLTYDEYTVKSCWDSSLWIHCRRNQFIGKDLTSGLASGICTMNAPTGSRISDYEIICKNEPPTSFAWHPMQSGNIAARYSGKQFWGPCGIEDILFWDIVFTVLTMKDIVLWIWCHVDVVRTDISEEHIASIFTVSRLWAGKTYLITKESEKKEITTIKSIL